MIQWSDQMPLDEWNAAMASHMPAEANVRRLVDEIDSMDSSQIIRSIRIQSPTNQTFINCSVLRFWLDIVNLRQEVHHENLINWKRWLVEKLPYDHPVPLYRCIKLTSDHSVFPGNGLGYRTEGNTTGEKCEGPNTTHVH